MIQLLQIKMTFMQRFVLSFNQFILLSFDWSIYWDFNKRGMVWGDIVEGETMDDKKALISMISALN